MEKNTKLRAAIAGVMELLRQEAECAVETAPTVSNWALRGRMQQARQRTVVQAGVERRMKKA